MPWWESRVVHELMGWKNNDNPISTEQSRRRIEKEKEFHLHFFPFDCGWCLDFFFVVFFRWWYFLYVCQKKQNSMGLGEWIAPQKQLCMRGFMFSFRTHDKSHRKKRKKKFERNACFPPFFTTSTIEMRSIFFLSLLQSGRRRKITRRRRRRKNERF